jgi:Predicted acetyltransferase
MNFKYENEVLTLLDDDKVLGTINYKIEGDIYTILRVYVLPIYQGKGYGKTLLEEVVRYSKANKLKIKPVCSYAVVYFEKHSEYNDLLAK